MSDAENTGIVALESEREIDKINRTQLQAVAITFATGTTAGKSPIRLPSNVTALATISPTVWTSLIGEIMTFRNLR